MKKVCLVLALCMMLVAITACSDPEAGSQTQASGSGKVRVAFMVNKLSSSYWTDMEAGANAAADELGWEIEILCPITPDSNEEQIQLLEQALVNPPDVFIISPADAKGLTPVIEKINEAGIPIINYNNRFIDDGIESETFVGIDKYELAKLAGEALTKKMDNKGNALIIEGVTGSQTSNDIKKGATEALEASSGIKILDSKPANNLRTEGLTVTQDLLQKYPEVDAIFAANAESAFGATEAIRQSNRQGIMIGTINMSDEVAQALKDGTLTVVADDVPYDVGYETIKAAQRCLDGEELPEEIMVEGVIVDKDTVGPYLEKYGIK